MSPTTTRERASTFYGVLRSDWKVVRFSYVANPRNGQLDPSRDEHSEKPLIAPNHIEAGTGRLLLLESAREQGAESGKYAVEKGDVVYSKIRPALRKVVLAPVDGLCSADMYALRPARGVDARFLVWLILSEGFSQAVVLESLRVAMPKVNRDTLGGVPVPLPPLDDQRAIASFLDRKTAAIDALIEKKERLISLLEEKRQALITQAVTKGLDPSVLMKDSGIEWLGEIPAHWEVTRLKHIASVRSGVAKGRQLQGSTISVPYLRVANVQDGHLDLSDVAEMPVNLHEVDRFSLQAGDVLMNEGGDNDKLGRGAIWTAPFAPCIHQNHVFAVRPHSSQHSPWIALSTQGAGLKSFFCSRAKQSTNLASISSSNLKEAPFALPPPGEMGEVIGEVESRLNRIRQLSECVVQHVERLREYRQALITAAVTGQLDIQSEPSTPTEAHP